MTSRNYELVTLYDTSTSSILFGTYALICAVCLMYVRQIASLPLLLNDATPVNSCVCQDAEANRKRSSNQLSAIKLWCIP